MYKHFETRRIILRIFLTTGGQVNFPGLGLTIENLIEGFEIFGVHISLSGILIAISMFLGLFITERLAKKSEQNTEHYLDLAIRLVLASVIGARIGYVLSHWQYFITDQGNVLNISDGGMSATGAIIAGLLVSFLYCRQKKLSWLQVCDTSLPGIVCGQIVASLGCFFGRNMLGTFSDGTFAMQVAIQDVDNRAKVLGRSSSQMIRGNYLQVHPVALYEAVILLALLIVLAILWKVKKLNGLVMSLYLMGYGLMVFSMEFIRLDSQKISGSPFSIEHIIAAALFLFGLTVLVEQVHKYRLVTKAQPKNLNAGKNK
jgi:phosphatidylglycerol:prolipoprotein diacylglycerol transferase